MDPLLNALLLSWDWRVEVIVILLLTGSVYSRGWWRLRRRGTPSHRLATGWRLAAYLGGLAALGLALISPIDVLGGQLFLMHMIQHLLLVMIAPPLLLIANPLPFFMWGLSVRARRALGQLFNSGSAFRRALRTLTAPGMVWMLFVAFFLGWHDPNAYNAALRSDLIHDLEHVTFFGSSMLYWWQVTGAGPRLRSLSHGVRIAFLLLTVPVNAAAGIAIAFASQPIYTYYTTVPRLLGMSVMQDQMIGGVIMWIPGSMMYLLAALILISGLMRADDNRHSLSEPVWATDEGMVAPGWET
ncbi:MAG: cytochrome c oxidase assembly protein [Anaerolineales bacterium]|nr:MAG: cytochrome c oxidase assembly protein [Anaerolineales bacterium]